MADERPWAGRRLHLVGLGGAGMSGYARVATQLGAAVSGSDRADSRALRALAELGVEVHVGHDAANVPAGEGVEVVHSTAIAQDNPERLERAQAGRVGTVGARDDGAEQGRDAGIAAHPGPAQADQVQPPPGPRSLVRHRGER